MRLARVFDVETTGVDPKENRVIEVAAYDLLDDLTLSRVGSCLVDPGRAVPPESSAIHHLTDADLIGAKKLGEVLVHYMDDAPAVFVAHNCEFEKGYLPTPQGVQWICTYKCALRAWPDAPSHQNQVLRYWLGLDGRPGFDRALASLAHRAEPDTYVTGWILAELLKSSTLDQLVAWTNEPKHFTTFTFGKHRGMKLSEAPVDYLQWLRDGRHDMDPDWRACAARELSRRIDLRRAQQSQPQG